MSGRSILVVEDQFLVGRDLRRALTDFGYEVSLVVSSGHEALAEADRHVPDLVLMDIGLNGPLDGIQTAAQLQARHHVPIVYLTSHSDAATLSRATETGPYGYLVKPFRDAELRASIEVAFGRHDLERKSVEKAARLASANLELRLRNEERKHDSERLLGMARTDPLTEAANRLCLQQDLEGILDRARRYGHQYCAAFCDIDCFKSYNDTFGHLAGDEAIRVVSQEFKRRLRKGDGFYRYGGDEFLVLLPEQALLGAWECMERVRCAVAAVLVATDGRVLARSVTISVGVADFRMTPDEDPIESWLHRADAALYRAKSRGRNCVQMAGRSASPLPTRAAAPPGSDGE